MIAIRSSVDCLAPFGACAHTDGLVAAAATDAALIRNSRRSIQRSLFANPDPDPGPDLFLLRQRVRDRPGRRIRIGRLFRGGPASSATTSSAASAFVRHDDEVLTSLGLVADRNAARSAVECAGPQHFARIFV